ncbi:MAG TPA: TIGR02996 domain-containing protein [Gemmata sp.]|nr:TIGR02996 domain-containing protein [Gemmata sp.]
MTDREALFRAILDNPDDDTLRLIYADALEEEGDARRAAFIRCQIEFAKVPEYDPVWIRVRYLDPDKMFGTWLIDELPALPERLSWAREPFRRGFPAAIQSNSAAAFVDHADELFALAPIEAVELVAPRLAEVTTFAKCPWRNRLIRLSVVEGLGGQSARRLFGSAHYERLKELHIGAALSTDDTASAIVRSHTFKQLTTLSCRADRASDLTLVNELIQLADPPRLKTLDLSGNRLSGEQLRRLTAAPALSLVEDLDLSDNNLGAEAVGAVARAHLPHLRSLHLLRTRPEEDGVRALSEAEYLSDLRSLTLGGNYLSPTVAAILADSKAVANLRDLDLRENRLGDLGATSLANSPHLRNLAHLDLSSNLIEDDGADALAESPYLGGLIYLDLRGNIISTPAATRLKRRFWDRVVV